MNTDTPHFRPQQQKLKKKKQKYSSAAKTEFNPRFRSNSHQVRSPRKSNETALTEDINNRDVPNDSKYSSPISFNESELNYSSRVLSRHLMSPIIAQSKSNTQRLAKQIKESLAELREEADNYMNSSQRALNELSGMSRRRDEKMFSLRERSGSDVGETPYDFQILEQLKNLSSEIQSMQFKLSQNEVALCKKRQENSKLKELLGAMVQKVNEKNATEIESDGKSMGCTTKCVIM